MNSPAVWQGQEEAEATVGFTAKILATFLVLVITSSVISQEYVVPISANSPHVFMSLTAERDPDDVNFFSIPNAPPGEEGLPVNAEAHYEVAIFDTGAPATIIGHEAYLSFDIRGAKRDGINITPLGGVGPTVDAINSDPLGVYAVGFDGLLINPRTGAQTVDRSQLRGTFNDSILYGPPNTELPNLIGTTTSSHYTTVMNYSDPRIIEYDGETYRSPSVAMFDLGGIAAPDRRIGMTLVAGQLGVPTFLPDLAAIADNIDDLGNNPQAPTIAGSFWLTANVTNNGVTRNRLDAIFDTGAQGSFVSEQLAAEMGFDVINDDPDFVVRIAGVTGVSEEVPGFYADRLSLPGTDGGLVLENVPLIVFNLTDPSDGQNTLDALIGMNLFSGRDLVLNPEPGRPYLGVSDPALPFHSWSTSAETAAWSNFQSWSDPGIPAVDWYADVRNVTGSPQTAVIDEDVQVGMFVTGSEHVESGGTITTSITSGNTLTIFGNAILEPGGGIHLEDATIAPLAVEIRGGTISGTGTVEGEVLSQGHLVPGGLDAIGMLKFPGSLDQLSLGTLHIEIGDNSIKDAIQFDRLDIDGAMSLEGELALSTTDGYQPLAPGENESYRIIVAESDVFGAFAEYSFNGEPMEQEFPFASERRSFRDHVGNGQFISVIYQGQNAVAIRNEQALVGDANGDGEVQFQDFIAVSANFGRPATWTEGDFTGDGTVSFADFLALSGNFGKVVETSLATVPEPSLSWATLSLLALIGQFRSRQRTSSF